MNSKQMVKLMKGCGHQMAKKKYVIKNYKKYFKKPAGTVMTDDMVADGIPAQRKVLFPA